MNAALAKRVLLIDKAEGPGRTTATLVASLAARLTALHFVSGADAIGSLTAGFAALGREVSCTAQGASLRKAIEAGRPGANGTRLWRVLRIDEWASTIPPSPVLDQLRNDLALLLADDLETILELLPIPSETVGEQGTQQLEPVTFVDCLLGLWAFSVQLVHAVEALVAPTLAPLGEVTCPAGPSPEPESTLLR